MLLGSLRVVLAWAHINRWVSGHHRVSWLETPLLIIKSLDDLSAVKMRQLFHFRSHCRLNRASRFGIGARPCISIEILFELKLAIKPQVL